MRALPGARILLSHSPDPFPRLPRDVALMLAGHTHCGQVRLPLIGAVKTMSAYGQRYACGLIRENGRTLIVTAGLGTSGLPLRLRRGAGLVAGAARAGVRPAAAPSPRR